MAELPSGTVTFLFTDIEGSTRLVRQLRAQYAEVLADHQRLLRAAFVEHDGYEVDTQGDSFFVAFANARDALLAAVEGQLALSSHRWPDGVEIRVRMGVHTGQAIASHGRYTGLAVNRGARIAAAGHGGQVLVSQATQALLEDEEDLHVDLRDLGEQRLKDFDRPVRLYQAAAEGLPESFPPLRPAAELAQAAEEAIRPPVWRRPAVLAAAGIALAALLAVTAFVATRNSAGGLSGVQANNLGIIDPGSNEIVAEVPVGVRPGPVAVGAGSVWVGNMDDRTLTRIDPATRDVERTIPLENQTPTGVAVGPDTVWVAHGLRGSLSRVDPQFNQVAEPIPVAGRSNDGSVAIGAGFVWAVYGDSTLARVDPASSDVTRGFAGAAPSGLVIAMGALWVANSGDSTVHRFNPTTFEQGPIRPISVGRRPTGIAFGHGAIWVANAGDDNVTRIDPSSNSTLTIPVGDGPSAIAAGAGAVWVANTAGQTVSRIDPATNEVVETIDIGSAPAGIAVGEGFVWVTAQTP